LPCADSVEVSCRLPGVSGVLNVKKLPTAPCNSTELRLLCAVVLDTVFCSNVRKLNSNLFGWGKPYLKAEKAVVFGS